MDRLCSLCNETKDENYFYNYSKSCKECCKNRAMLWRIANPDRYKNLHDGWKSANKEHLRKLSKAYRQRPERKIAQRIHNLNRLRREKNAPGAYKPKHIRQLLRVQDGLCATCRCDISTNYTIDHICPISKGGSNWPENLQLLCNPCNSRKGDRIILPSLPRLGLK